MALGEIRGYGVQREHEREQRKRGKQGRVNEGLEGSRERKIDVSGWIERDEMEGG